MIGNSTRNINQNIKNINLKDFLKYIKKLKPFSDFCKNFQRKFFLRVNINSPL